MIILLLKNSATKLVKVVPFKEEQRDLKYNNSTVSKDYLFPSLVEATERGERELKQTTEYTSFNTMQVNVFIELMAMKFNGALQ